MNFANCYTKELDIRIRTICKNIQYKVHKPIEKCHRLLTFVTVSITKSLLLFFDI